jgi:CheY-like chemotaxis protein
MPLIMVVEDDQDIQSIIETALTDGGFEITIVASGEDHAFQGQLGPLLRAGD